MSKETQIVSLPLFPLFIAVFALVIHLHAGAQALPVNPQVINGAASFGNTRLIGTNTPGTNINWQSFNIGTGNTVRFVQPNAASINRVTGGPPSAILGNLVSNGKVFQINPNGLPPNANPPVIESGPLMQAGAFQAITSDGAYTIRTLPAPPTAATRAVIGVDGVVRLTAQP